MTAIARNTFDTLDEAREAQAIMECRQCGARLKIHDFIGGFKVACFRYPSHQGLVEARP